MSKYDFDLDLSGNTSTGIILGKVNKGSVVLEFGCATGRMMLLQACIETALNHILRFALLFVNTGRSPFFF